MYHNKLVVGIFANNRKLAEDGSQVFLPFGTEYEIHLKNVSTRKMAATVEIDGEDIMEGRQLVLEPDKQIKLKRFFEGSMDGGRRFKFIKMSKEIAAHRGERVDDSLIRITYFREKDVQWAMSMATWYPIVYYNTPGWRDSQWIWPWSFDMPKQSSSYHSSEVNCVSTSFLSGQSAPTVASGITVPGYPVDQKFIQSHMGELEPNGSTMIVQLVGKVGEGKVEKPVLAKGKQKCPTCGKPAEQISNYCSQCGTGLKRFN